MEPRTNLVHFRFLCAPAVQQERFLQRSSLLLCCLAFLDESRKLLDFVRQDGVKMLQIFRH
jgi:hypothetical protein